MKRLSIVLGVVLAISSCTNRRQLENAAIVSGKIYPVYDNYIAFTFGEFLDSTKINEQGEFFIEIPAAEPGYGILMYNNSLVEIYLEAEKTLELTINSNNFPESIDFGGELGGINHYSQLYRKLENQSGKSNDELYKMEPGDFVSYSDSLKKKKLRLLEEYVAKFPDLDPEFSNNKEIDILYEWAIEQMLYPGYYTIVNNKIPDIPDNYHETYMQSISLENSQFLENDTYKTFLKNYLDYREAAYLEENPEVQKLWFPGSVSRFRVIHQHFSDQDIKNFLLYSSMDDHLDNFGIEHIESFITNFRIACTNEKYQALIEEKYKTYETLVRGEKAPDLTFYNRSGKKVKLSDLRGQLVYINFWSSWSHWSIQEMPMWEKLRKDFENEEINFVCVSMDFVNDKNKWEYILDKEELGGLQLIQDQESSAYQDVYFINDLPRYMLFDKHGKIISIHAPRPSENMDAVLPKLLQEQD